MRIVFLVETAAQIWGGVKVVLENANWLAARGRRVTVLSKSGPPDWMGIHCDFRTVPDFSPEQIPAADIVVGTFWSTVPHAVRAASQPGAGVPVHFCQGYEGDNPENAPVKDQIEAVYRDRSASKITISQHLTDLMRDRFGCEARPVTYAVNHQVMFPSPTPSTAKQGPVRVGLVGPYEIAWKDIRTGMQACALAHRAGLDLQLVRVTNTTPHPEEQNLPFPVEWHQKVPPARMGEIYRSMDVFLGTSRGPEEGFFLPAVEAMACGVPSVLTDIPCFTGYGEGQYALFAEPGDAQQIAEALVIVSKHPKVAAQLRHDGICVARKYTPENHVTELERAFREILTEAQGGSSNPPSALLQAVRDPSIPAAPPRPTVNAEPRHEPQPQAQPQPHQAPPLAALQATPPGTLQAPSPDTLTVTAPETSPAPLPRPEDLKATDENLDQLSEGLTSALHAASEAHVSRGNFEEALHHVQAAVCIRPDDRELLSELARLYYLTGQDQNALGVYDELISHGEDGNLCASRAMVLYSLGDFTGAVAAFQQAIRCAPPTTELLNNLGVAQFQAGDREGARRSFEQALDLEPDHADATANLKSLAG